MLFQITRKLKLICPLVFFLVPYFDTFALPEIASRYPTKSLLVPIPTNRKLYETEYAQLPRNRQWELRIFGLREAPLDPTIWGYRDLDGTLNRSLVPIKPFYLRISENPNFHLSELEFDFLFHTASEKYMRKIPDRKDPIFEIGFAGEISLGEIGQPALIDRGYALRLSAFPPFSSGIFYRLRDSYTLVAPGNPTLLKTGTQYNVKIELSPNSVKVYLDNHLYSSYQHPKLDVGLVNAITSWNPIHLLKLEVTGALSDTGESIKTSGLIKFNDKER